MSQYTKVCRLKLWLFRIIDILLLVGPLIFYFFAAVFDEGVSKAGKVTLVSTVAVALVLVIFNIVAQKHLRCPIWIVVVGFFVCIKETFLPLIIMLAIVSILDDLVLTPLISYYRTKLIANKAIDEREREANARGQD